MYVHVQDCHQRGFGWWVQWLLAGPLSTIEEANSDEESGKMEEARIKATQKSRDHREKLKKKGGRKRGKSDDGEGSSDSENEER